MRSIVLLLSLAVSSFPVLAQEQCGPLVHRILEAYGCLDSLKSYPAQLQRQISGQLARDSSMSDADKARFVQTLEKSVSADRLVKSVEDRLSTNCNPPQLENLLAEIQSPLVQKMRAFEAASQTAEGSAKLEQYFNAPDTLSPPEERKKLIAELMQATDATGVMVNTIVETSRGMVEGMGGPPATPQQITDMRKQVHSGTEAQLTKITLATYHDATDEELQQYVAVLRRPEFQKFNGDFGKAVAEGMGTEARFTGAAMKELLDQMKAEQDKQQQPPASPKPKK